MPRLPYITLTTSKTKATTIPEDRTLYDFSLRSCITIPVTFVIYSSTHVMRLNLSERGSYYGIRGSTENLAYPKSEMFFYYIILHPKPNSPGVPT